MTSNTAGGPIVSVARRLLALDRLSLTLLRLGVIVVFLWIGGLKWFKYEADGIIPFIANSPLMRWMIGDPAGYKPHMNPEGVLNEANRAWHEANSTYPVAIFVGATIVAIGLLLAAHWIRPELGMLGAAGVIGFSVVTLSFLITTPEVWVSAPAQGAADADLGFPYLSGRGRLVVKDCIQMGAGFVLLVDSARATLRRRGVSA
ncbi:YkgB family protein [Actinomyces bowdenii]|uniref:YkgB family protein n=1 Tax=Actinomyces bowdenii TaxID=131109 RepID=UPI001ABC2C79|nr:YkgB family protein [Actinomyces bowdenii]MBO3725676.1 YkgB family protein [Actinomyces bowdenii]